MNLVDTDTDLSVCVRVRVCVCMCVCVCRKFDFCVSKMKKYKDLTLTAVDRCRSPPQVGIYNVSPNLALTQKILY